MMTQYTNARAVRVITRVCACAQARRSTSHAMVQLLIKLREGAEEWGLVELQGQLETRNQVPFDDMHIGDLHFDSKGTPNLIIGHHLLTGKIVELEKPYAVLRKRGGRGRREEDSDRHLENSPVSYGRDNSPAPMDTETAVEEERTGSVQTEYEIIALITRKIIFKNRPKPIITKALPRKIT